MAKLNDLERMRREKSIVKAGGIGKYIENIRRIVRAEGQTGEKLKETMALVNDMERKLKQSFPHLDYGYEESRNEAITALA